MPNTASIYDFSANLLDGTPIGLDYFRGKVLLVVNVASKCGLTPQYAALETLYKEYNARGFEVLAFPCNQFAQQEPGSASEIATFCEKNYGVSFPVFAKIDVNGPQTHPLYQWLKLQKRGKFWLRRIKWNFEKFLVGRDGQGAGRYLPPVSPLSLRGEIERLLGAK